MSNYVSFVCLLLLGTVVSHGCSKDRLGRKAVSGTITFNGQPLDTGSIQFSPQQPQGFASGGIIRNGEYSVAREKGLPPGTYTVRIYSPVDMNAAPAESEVLVPGPVSKSSGPRQPPPAVERIPPEFNVASTQTVEVTADGDNTFDFEING